jgi:hypothetical protein
MNCPGKLAAVAAFAVNVSLSLPVPGAMMMNVHSSSTQ